MSLIKLTLWQGGQPLYVLPSEVVTIAPCWRDHDAALVDLRTGKFHKVLGTSEQVHAQVFGATNAAQSPDAQHMREQGWRDVEKNLRDILDPTNSKNLTLDGLLTSVQSLVDERRELRDVSKYK